jgi:CubicO group peptidase (beta-lactamase class C family)
MTAARTSLTSTLDEGLLRRLFEDAARRSGTFGAQLSIIKGRRQIEFATGVSNAERAEEMTTDTLMQIGSITKVFNATIVMSLVSEGVLDLDAPVNRYISTLELANPEAPRTLSLRHLLSMSSGLDNGRYVYFGGGDDALGQYVRELRSLPQYFPPGKHFGYSNAGICIAGHAAATAAGKPWEALLQERILRPAGLERSAVLDSDLLGRRVSAGHDPSPSDTEVVVREATFSPHRARAPSGPTLALAAGDLARFGKIFISGGVANTGCRILSEHATKVMLTPHIQVPSRVYGDRWCLGPSMADWNGIEVWGHSGGTLTSSSSLRWIPHCEAVVAFIVNTPSSMGEFSRAVYGEFFEAAFGFSKPRVDLPDCRPAANLQRYVGVYKDLGITMDVTAGEGNTLRARYVAHRTSQELVAYQPDQSAVLTPLGGDRFLVDSDDGPSKLVDSIDTAFFGDDDEGHATNVLYYSFPMRRVGS